MNFARNAVLARAMLRDAYLTPAPRATGGPLVSVVIAAYNRSEVLRYALACAVRQSYAGIEILVVGDACTDGSEQVASETGDSRVRWINLPENSGSQAGPNQAGLEAARGDLVAYLGQDDLWRRDHIALLVADLERRGADVSSTILMTVWPRPAPVRRFVSPALGDFVPPSALMHRRAAAQVAGGWRDHRQTVLPPDADFIRRLRESGARFARVQALSVVKFPSTLRRNSYRDRRSDEQARFARRIDDPGFVAREVLTAAGMLPLRPWAPQAAIDPRAATVPGGVVAECRRIRGLG